MRGQIDGGRWLLAGYADASDGTPGLREPVNDAAAAELYWKGFDVFLENAYAEAARNA